MSGAKPLWLNILTELRVDTDKLRLFKLHGNYIVQTDVIIVPRITFCIDFRMNNNAHK